MIDEAAFAGESGDAELSTIDRVIALRRVAVFAAVPGRTLAAVARAARQVTVRDGDIVIAEGAMEDHLFVVVSGLLQVVRDQRRVADVRPGETVGELAALIPEPRSATVVAAEPALLLRIDKPVLDELLVDHPDLASAVIAALVRLIRQQPPGGMV